MNNIIDGKLIATKYKELIKEKVTTLSNKGINVGLAVIEVGENPASRVYVSNKLKACQYTGIKSFHYKMDENTTQNEIKNLILSLNENNNIDGILVQLPLPKHLDESYILSLINYDKDVDGFSAYNVGNLLLNKPSTVSCTPLGIMKLLEEIKFDLSGKNAVIIGRSNIVGKPMSALLINASATVTVCHSKTKNIKDITKNADIIIVAIGKPHFLKSDMVKDGCVIIDVGINRVDGKLVGDVDFDNVSKKALYITPVPGGVGPMTISMLLLNTLFLNESRKYE